MKAPFKFEGTDETRKRIAPAGSRYAWACIGAVPRHTCATPRPGRRQASAICWASASPGPSASLFRPACSRATRKCRAIRAGHAARARRWPAGALVVFGMGGAVRRAGDLPGQSGFAGAESDAGAAVGRLTPCLTHPGRRDSRARPRDPNTHHYGDVAYEVPPIRQGRTARFLLLAGTAARCSPRPRTSTRITRSSWSCGYAPGGGNDVAARLLAMGTRVHPARLHRGGNRAGAGTIIAASYVARSGAGRLYPCRCPRPRWRSMSRCIKSWTMTPIKDFEPVAIFRGSAQPAAGQPPLPVNSIADLVDYGKEASRQAEFLVCRRRAQHSAFGGRALQAQRAVSMPRTFPIRAPRPR